MGFNPFPQGAPFFSFFFMPKKREKKKEKKWDKGKMPNQNDDWEKTTSICNKIVQKILH